MRDRFRTLHTVFHATGALFIALGVLLWLPLVVAALTGEIGDGRPTVRAFMIPSVAALAIGFCMRRFFQKGAPNSVQAMLLCAVGWVLISAVGALPFLFLIETNFLDAYFETVSGFTTTGITMYEGLDAMPRTILFWRALTQWVGGLGILSFFLAITRGMGAVHTIYGAEGHKISSGRPVPGILNTVRILWSTYAGITLAVAVGLALAGSSVFDSVCHAFTALSTGGFSPYDASISYYKQAGFANYKAIEYILIAGMFAGGMSFLVHYRVLTGRVGALFDNTEMRWWWRLIIGFCVLILLERWAGSGDGFWHNAEEEIRVTLFQVVSLLTTTGFGTEDIGGSWFGAAAKQLFLVMMVIGGCVGSTGGGIKVLRIVLLGRLYLREMFMVRAPRRALNDVRLDGKLVGVQELQRLSGLFFMWMVLLFVGAAITALLTKHDALASASGMFSAVGNIGPCYISVSDMVALPDPVKIVYIFGMLAGRLEILPVLLMLSPKAWR